MEPVVASAIEAYIGLTVRLLFTDGECVRAQLVSVSPIEHEDLIFELLEVLVPSNRGAGIFEAGDYCLTALSDLVSWEPDPAVERLNEP